MYSFHYVDSDGLNWRFDRHPNTHTPEIHFHRRPTPRRLMPTVLYRRDGGVARDPYSTYDVASGIRE